jgi:HAD superfamily hydrolase (TIGR01509 family)
VSLEALIWDVDGTLAETECEGHRVAFNLAFEEAGLPWRWDPSLYGELLAVTGGKERLLAWWRRVDPAGVERPGTAATVSALHARKTAHYLALLDAGAIPLRPGVARLIAQARKAGLRQAIATTTTPDNVLRLLETTLGRGAAAWFEIIGAGDVVPCKKPAPDIYHWVLERLGLVGGQCLAIEDSAAGVAAARGAGVPVLLTRSHYTRSERIEGALADLDGLGEPGRTTGGHVGQRRGSRVIDIVRLRLLHAGAMVGAAASRVPM